LKLKNDTSLSIFAFNFNLRPYTTQPENNGYFINMMGYLKLGGESETVLGGGDLFTSVAYQVRRYKLTI
jgi:hypothetical protein